MYTMIKNDLLTLLDDALLAEERVYDEHARDGTCEPCQDPEPYLGITYDISSK